MGNKLEHCGWEGVQWTLAEITVCQQVQNIIQRMRKNEHAMALMVEEY